jgi:hypothetical protein
VMENPEIFDDLTAEENIELKRRLDKIADLLRPEDKVWWATAGMKLSDFIADLFREFLDKGCDIETIRRVTSNAMATQLAATEYMRAIFDERGNKYK